MGIEFTPNTQIRLYSGVPLNSSYEESIDFASADAQYAWMEQYVKYTTSDFTYQREEGIVRVKWEYDKVVDCNYMAYRNLNYTDKWFYAFIKKVEYKAPQTTWLYIEQDVYQTWMFDFRWLPSFIERETVDDDTPYKHTIPEGVECGPYVHNIIGQYPLYEMGYVMAVARSSIYNQPAQVWDGVFSGATYIRFFNTQADIDRLNQIIDVYANAGELSNILGIFAVPQIMLLFELPTIRVIADKPTDIDGYTFKNNKLLCYPYRYVSCSNEQGTENQLRYERFRNPYDFRFAIRTSVNMQSTAQCNPMDYSLTKGRYSDASNENWNEGVVLTNFPQCTWSGNIYANWYAQNANTINNQIKDIYTALGVGGAASILSLNPMMAVQTGIGAIHSTNALLARVDDMAAQPFQLQQRTACNVSNIKWGRTGFVIREYSITAEFAKMVDDYFSLYGYKVNRLGVPNLHGRKAWDYIKTSDAKLVGEFPESHLLKLKQIFNKGFTIWHGSIGDYTRDNAPVNQPPIPSYPEPSEPADYPTVTPTPLPPDPENPDVDASDIPTTGWGPPFDGWEGHVSSEWGWRTDPFTGEQKFHNGIDIAYPAGTIIKAVHAGTVSAQGYNSVRGNFIDVRMTDGSYYRCQHMKGVAFGLGETVELGVELGTVGSTGQVTGPHLHLEIYGTEGSVNPRLFLPVG